MRIKKANNFAEGLRGILSGLLGSVLTQRQMVDELNNAGVRTARGCEFKLVTVQRLLKRLELSTALQ